MRTLGGKLLRAGIMKANGSLLPGWMLTGSPKEVHLYIDRSLSMKGFKRGKASPLYRLGVKLKGALFTEHIFEFYGSGFGESAERLRKVDGIIEGFLQPSDRPYTCLAAPFDSEAALPRIRQRESVVVVLTDGVASSAKGSCGRGCSAGSDVTCVADAIVRYVQRGFGLWVMRFEMPFEGTYYPEACPSSGLRVPAGSSRGVFLWIGSSDYKIGRALVRSLLAEKWEARPSAFEVWPGEWNGWRVAPGATPGNWKPQAFAPHSPLNCGNKNVLVLEGIKSEDSRPVVMLRHSGRSSGGAGVWAGRVPLVSTTEKTLEGATALIKVRADSTLSLKGGDVLRMGPAGDGGGRDVCLRTASKTAELGLGWGAENDIGPLVAFSTDDDCQIAEMTKTLNLQTLWGLVTHRLCAGIGEGYWTPLMKVRLLK